MLPFARYRSLSNVQFELLPLFPTSLRELLALDVRYRSYFSLGKGLSNELSSSRVPPVLAVGKLELLVMSRSSVNIRYKLLRLGSDDSSSCTTGEHAAPIVLVENRKHQRLYFVLCEYEDSRKKRDAFFSNPSDFQKDVDIDLMDNRRHVFLKSTFCSRSS